MHIKREIDGKQEKNCNLFIYNLFFFIIYYQFQSSVSSNKAELSKLMFYVKDEC